MPDPPELAGEVARRVLASGKYRALDPALVHRVAGEAAGRARDRTEAVKYAKRKLHQAYGAFLAGSPERAVTAAVAAVRAGQADLPAAARTAMRTHASTAERLAYLEPFYDQVAAWCGAPRTVVDLACGLNPLAVPWMRLGPQSSYWCCEIDAELVSALAELDAVLPVQLTSAVCDLVGAPPRCRADLALLLKTVATLEQQRAGATSRLLQQLDCRYVVVSLARRSLSGRRGYTDAPQEMVAAAAAGSGYQLADEATVGDEQLLLLTA